MAFFLKSRRNRLIIVILALLLIALPLPQYIISHVLSKSNLKIAKYLSENFGYNFKFNNISFDLLTGLHLKNLSIFYPNQNEAAVFFKDVSISIKIMPLFLRKLVISRINIDEAVLVSKREEGGINLQIIFSDIYKKISETKPMAFKIDINSLSTYLGLAKLTYLDAQSPAKRMSVLLKDACIFIYKSGKVKFKGDVKFTYQIPKENYISRFLNNRYVDQDLKCTMQGTINNKDFRLDMLLLNLGKEQIVGLGLVKNFIERNPYIDIVFIPSIISVNNIAFLKNNFDPEGNVLIALKLNGLLDNIKPIVNLNLVNCDFRYCLPDGEIFDIENMRGKIEYKDGSIKLENVYLKFNNLPLNIKLHTNISPEPDIFLNISLSKEFLSYQDLPMENLDAIFKGKIKNTIVGDLGIKTLYRRGSNVLQLEAYFSNIDFDYYNLKEKYFRAANLELIKNNNIGDIQKLNFADFDSQVNLSKNRLDIKQISFNGYNSRLKGEINIDLKDKVALKIILIGRGLDVKTLMQDMQITNKLLSGNLDTKIVFNNRLKEFIKGDCYIKDGIINLDALANNVKFPSLKNTNFDIMHVFFAISKDLIKIRGIKILSPKIMLNAYWDTNNRIDGALNIKISSRFLKESARFKKLLDLTRIKSPYIDFRFLLGGIPKATRFMWMKNEFKDKIEQALTPGIKKSIEANLDKMVEDLSNK